MPGAQQRSQNEKEKCRGVRLGGSDWKWRGGCIFISVLGNCKVPGSRRAAWNKFRYYCKIYALHQLPFCKITTKFYLDKLK